MKYYLPKIFFSKSYKNILVVCGFSMAQMVCSPSVYAGMKKYSEKMGEKIVELKTKKLANPEIHELSTYLVRSQNNEENESYNIVYSIGLAQSSENQEKIAIESDRLKKVLKTKQARKITRKLIKYQFAKMFSLTKKGKEKQQKKMLEVFGQFSELIGSDEEYANYLKNEKIDRYVYSGIKEKKTHLRWIYKPDVTLEHVYKDIVSGKVKNAIFIVHGDENGFVYDSLGNRFDGSFFNLVTPALSSIGFFSCHGDHIMNTYKFDDLSPVSYQKPRFIFTVPKSEKLNGEALSLSSGIKYFIREIDEHLYKSSKNLDRTNSGFAKERLPVEEEKKICSVKVDQFKSGGDIFTLRLNRQFIGAFSTDSAEFNFDCKYLKPDSQNILLIVHPNKDKNYSKNVFSKDQDFQVTLNGELESFQIDKESIQNFSHEPESGEAFYRSSKIKFSIR